jgi:hypothetical protein
VDGVNSIHVPSWTGPALADALHTLLSQPGLCTASVQCASLDAPSHREISLHPINFKFSTPLNHSFAGACCPSELRESIGRTARRHATRYLSSLAQSPVAPSLFRYARL